MTPREHVINAIQGNGNGRVQSPRQEQEATMGMGNLSLGRSSGQAYANQAGVQMQMPPMGQRMPSSRSQWEVESPVERQERQVERGMSGDRPSASREASYTQSISMRPAPPSGALPPPPPVPGKDPLGLYEQRRQQWAVPQSQNGYSQQSQPQQQQQSQNGYYGSSGYGRENERQYGREDQNGRGYRDDRNNGY